MTDLLPQILKMANYLGQGARWGTRSADAWRVDQIGSKFFSKNIEYFRSHQRIYLSICN